MSPRRVEHDEVVIGGPLEQVAKIVAVGVQGSAAEAGQKRDSCQVTVQVCGSAVTKPTAVCGDEARCRRVGPEVNVK